MAMAQAVSFDGGFELSRSPMSASLARRRLRGVPVAAEYTQHCLERISTDLGLELQLSSRDEEKCLKENDRRTKKEAFGDDPDFLEFIVELTMEFGGSAYGGTGTIVKVDHLESIGSQNTTGRILTCAHNVCDKKKSNQPADNVWFEIKKKGRTVYKGSITKIHVHPEYLRRDDGFGYDIAVCDFTIDPSVDGDLVRWIRSVQGEPAWPGCTAELYGTTDADSRLPYSFEITGYPGEYEGELWGMVAGSDAPYNPCPGFHRALSGKILYYSSIDTSGGQSGSPIYQCNGMCGTSIYGVHNGGMTSKNWGTVIDNWTLETLQ